MTGKRVLVLMGGWSPEREVSLNSGAAAAIALQEAGYRVLTLDASLEQRTDLSSQIAEHTPDVVFNALHGAWGEDGCVQGMLEVLGLPYTHSGVLASSLAMDKQRAKSVLEESGIKTPHGSIHSRQEIVDGTIIDPPLVIKPNQQGSSVGVFIVAEGQGLPNALYAKDWDLGDELLVEEFIGGRELTVAVMGHRALCVTEITTNLTFYDYEAKYAEGGSTHTLPADIPDDVKDACLEMSARAHNALGCRGLTRADFRWDDTKGVDGLYCLEVNTQPGLTATSLAPEQAAHCGISFPDLCAWMVEDASCGR